MHEFQELQTLFTTITRLYMMRPMQSFINGATKPIQLGICSKNRHKIIGLEPQNMLGASPRIHHKDQIYNAPFQMLAQNNRYENSSQTRTYLDTPQRIFSKNSNKNICKANIKQTTLALLVYWTLTAASVLGSFCTLEAH
jgi:hypothetical protein